MACVKHKGEMSSHLLMPDGVISRGLGSLKPCHGVWDRSTARKAMG